MEPTTKIGKFAASKRIVIESWNILKHDREIMWFPVMSSILSFVIALVFAGIVFFTTAGSVSGGVAYYVIAFVYYLIMFFILNFFQAGVMIISHARFNGQDLGFKDGINGALSNSGKIFVWSLISATVGIILRIISDKSKIIGKIVAALLGAAWNIFTYFSLPSLIIGQKSIQDSFKESAAIIRKTWGEAIIVNFGVGLFFGIIIFAAIIIGALLAVLSHNPFIALAVFVLVFLFIIAISIISSTLSIIFKLALYEYARTGVVPQGFSPEIVTNAIVRKI